MPIIPDITWNPDEYGSLGGGPGGTVRSLAGPMIDLALKTTVAAAGPGVMDASTGAAPADRTVTIAGGTTVNVYDEALLVYPDAGVFEGSYEIIVTADVAVLYLDKNGDFPANTTFQITNQATIYGPGGNGGTPPGGGINGSAGSNAIELTNAATVNDVSIDNSAGYIFGGGGGGGGGGSATASGYNLSPGNDASAGGGGGGGGQGGSTGGTKASVSVTSLTNDTLSNALGTVTGAGGGATMSITQLATNGGNGTTGAAGAASVGAITTGTAINLTPETAGGAGGAGGAWGTAGNDGQAATANGAFSSSTSAPGTGGAAGKAVNLDGHTVVWLSGYNASQVKGAVS